MCVFMDVCVCLYGCRLHTVIIICLKKMRNKARKALWVKLKVKIKRHAKVLRQTHGPSDIFKCMHYDHSSSEMLIKEIHQKCDIMPF